MSPSPHHMSSSAQTRDHFRRLTGRCSLHTKPTTWEPLGGRATTIRRWPPWVLEAEMVNSVAEVSAAHMPSDVSSRLGFFDKFAGKASGFFSRAWFFALCVLLVLVWAPSFFLIGTVDRGQLIINTATTTS